MDKQSKEAGVQLLTPHRVAMGLRAITGETASDETTLAVYELLRGDSQRECVQHGGPLAGEYCGPECARLTRTWSRESVIDRVAAIDHWGARSEGAARSTAQRIVDALADDRVLSLHQEVTA